jgi:hypothetical protein
MNNQETDAVQTYFRNLCKFIIKNFVEVWTDIYGSHIIRVVLQVLGGVDVGQQVIWWVATDFSM